VRLSESLKKLGINLGRLKTGTPPRIDARTIDFTKTILQPGSDAPIYFSFTTNGAQNPLFLSAPANPVYPRDAPTEWRPKLPCYLVYTNHKTHEVIRANLHRAPLFTGVIKGIGPRYCPSIEDKIVRFAHKESHPLFLEPEGWETSEVYVQGANTSLPEDVQLAVLRSIPALEKVEMIRVGYAIEYDFVPPSQTRASLESKIVPGLFLAGQVNGTTGYEEAAGQGLIAGINAANLVKGKPPLILRRDQAYLGVMIDDLVTRELSEPYRLFTSRAEYRLLLRQDNADLRLTSIGYGLGLIDKSRYEAVEAKREAIAREIKRLNKTHFEPPNDERSTAGTAFLRRPEVSYETLVSLGLGAIELGQEVRAQVEIEVKYQGYIEMQSKEIDRIRRLEEWRIPSDIDFSCLAGLRTEASQKLNKFHPATLGQASRIGGVTPADIAILLVHMEKARRP
jgi:tRNA uridine 5-carboxymethylaminomethyl modification enzyme